MDHLAQEAWEVLGYWRDDSREIWIEEPARQLASSWLREGRFPDFLIQFLEFANATGDSLELRRFVRGESTAEQVIHDLSGGSIVERSARSPLRAVTLYEGIRPTLADRKIKVALRGLRHLRQLSRRYLERADRMRQSATDCERWRTDLIDQFEMVRRQLADADLLRSVCESLHWTHSHLARFPSLPVHDYVAGDKRRIVDAVCRGMSKVFGLGRGRHRTDQILDCIPAQRLGLAPACVQLQRKTLQALTDRLDETFAAAVGRNAARRRGRTINRTAFVKLHRRIDAVAVLVASGRSFDCNQKDALAIAISGALSSILCDADSKAREAATRPPADRDASRGERRCQGPAKLR